MYVRYTKSTPTLTHDKSRKYFNLHLQSISFPIHEALMAFNLDSMSMIPIPPCSIVPIIVFLFILSLVLHRKEKIILFMYLTSF